MQKDKQLFFILLFVLIYKSLLKQHELKKVLKLSFWVC